MSFHKNEYFSYVDLDLTNQIKQVLHFKYFYLIFYAFYKFQTKKNQKHKLMPTSLTGGHNRGQAMAGTWRTTPADGKAGRRWGGIGPWPVRPGRSGAHGGAA